jgi:hypothetical protein
VGSNLHECQARYLHLLGHLFQTVSDELVSVCKIKEPTNTALAKTWREHVDEGQNRAKIYGVVNGCNSNDLVHPFIAVSYSSLIILARENCKRRTGFQRRVLMLPQSTLHQKWRNMNSCCCCNASTIAVSQGRCPEQSRQVDALLRRGSCACREVPYDPDGKDMYDVLCSCFNFFLSSPIFVIYLSTNSNISQLAPPGSLARSARARENADALQAPITETPPDCSPVFSIESHKLTLNDVYEAEFMAQFGRPMWVYAVS